MFKKILITSSLLLTFFSLYASDNMNKNMKMDIRRQKKATGGYYASVAFMDAQVGKVLAALKKG